MESRMRRVSSLWALCLTFAGCSSEPPPTTERLETPLLSQQLADNAFSAQDPDVHYIPVLDAGDEVRLGARFDTLTGRIIASAPCITNYEKVSRGNADSQMRLVEVSDSQSTMRAMNIDASVQGGFLSVSGGAKASFVSDQKYTQQSQHFLLYAQATRTPRTMDPQQGESLFDLTQEARAALNDKSDPDAFRKLCGDGFVVAIYEGIELYGMLVFNNVTQDEKKTITASMNGKYGDWHVSSSANTTVNHYAEKTQNSLSIILNGKCDRIAIGGSNTGERWSSVVNGGNALQQCADTGANMISYKVVPYSSLLIKDWPKRQSQDPEFSLILNRYARYGTLLDSINQLLTAKPQAYQLALLHRGVDFATLDRLGNEIRAKRKALLGLLESCQSSPDPSARNASCATNQDMLNSLQGFPDPYLYRARLPLFFAAQEPVEAFLSDAQLSQRLLDRIQQRKIDACALSDKYGYRDDPACPANFDQLLQQAKAEIKVTPYAWPRNQGYVFITQSTSTNRCLVAPNKDKTIATTAACQKPYPKHQQRFLWQESYQLLLRKGECLGGRELAGCDSKKLSQLWRFVPSLNDAKIGLLQSAENSCLHHANVDRNVTYKACSADALSDDNFLWRALPGQ